MLYALNYIFDLRYYNNLQYQVAFNEYLIRF